MVNRVLVGLVGLALGGAAVWIVRSRDHGCGAVPAGTPAAHAGPPATPLSDPDDATPVDPVALLLLDDGTTQRVRAHDEVPSVFELRERSELGSLDVETWNLRSALNSAQKPSERRKVTRAFLATKATLLLPPDFVGLLDALRSEERSPTLRDRLAAAAAAVRKGESWARAFDAPLPTTSRGESPAEASTPAKDR